MLTLIATVLIVLWLLGLLTLVYYGRIYTYSYRNCYYCNFDKNNQGEGAYFRCSMIFTSAIRLVSNASIHISHTKEVNNMKMNKKLGMILLGIWLIMTGLLQVISITIPAIGIIMAILAIASGVLLLFGR